MDENEPRAARVGGKPGRGRAGGRGPAGARDAAVGAGVGAGAARAARVAGAAAAARGPRAAVTVDPARKADRAAAAKRVRAVPAVAKRARAAAGRESARRRRMIDGGELRLVMLKLIQDEPRHGYELIKAIEEMTGGNYAPSPGVIYPALSMLQEMDHIAAQEAQDGRRRFAITDAGKEQLGAAGEKIDGVIARLNGISTEQGRTEDSAIRRAMGSLRTALQERMSGGELPEATMTQITALIEDAAQKIAKLG